MNLLGLLRRRHIAALWGSQVLSAMGDHLFDLAVVWLAVRLAGSRAGLVVAAGALTRLGVGLLGGVLADRWDRRTAMIAADLLRATTLAPLPILARGDHLRLWHLALAAVLLAAFSSLFNPALIASLPSLARDVGEIQTLTTLMDGAWRLALALAPSMSGLLIAILPLPQFFTLDAVSFLVSAAAVASLGRHIMVRTIPSPHQRRRGVPREVRAAIDLVRGHTLLRWYVAAVAVGDMAWAAAFRVGLALFAARTLGGNVGAFGLLMGAYGVGNILSNLVVGSVAIRRRALVLVASQIVLEAGFAVVAAAPTLLWACLGTAISAIGGPMGDIVAKTAIQRDMPPDHIGKVYSLQLTAGYGGSGVGLLLAGPLFALLTPRVGIATCAMILVATGMTGFATFGWHGLTTPVLVTTTVGTPRHAED